MNDNEESHLSKTSKPSWEGATGKWKVEQLQLTQPGPGRTNHVLTPEEVRQLQGVAKAGAARFYFPKRLEAQFKLEQRQHNKVERLSISILVMCAFAFGPLWAHWVLSLPEGTRTLEIWLCLGIAAPTFAIAALFQYYFVTSELAEASLLIASCAAVIVIEMLRIHAATLGIYIVPTMTAAVLIGIFALVELPFRRKTILLVGYFAIIGFVDFYFGDAKAQRDISVWMNEIIVLTLTWIASTFSRINIRRAWAANILLETLASQDFLTGLSNRSSFEAHYEQQMRLARRYGKVSVLALIDLDDFKLVNDYYGHPYGDGVLVEIGLLLNDCARRPGDFAARIGGEEFALFLYDCTLEGAKTHLNSMVKAVQALDLKHIKSKVGVITISVGAVPLPVTSTLSKAYQLADVNLYKAKTEGRNRLVTSEYS